MLRILVVDDESKIRDLLEAELRAEIGCEVVQAISGNHAFTIASASHFDLIVSDISMPDGSGLDLLLALRRAGLKTPLVLFTATDLGWSDFVAPPLFAVVLKPNISALMNCIGTKLKEIA